MKQAFHFYNDFCKFVNSIDNVQQVKELVIANEAIAFIVCSIFEFSSSSASFNIGCVCFVRILCMINITFVEETLGENLVRLTLAISTFLVGFVMSGLEIFTGDMTTGVPFNLLTGNQTSTGDFSLNFVELYIIYFLG